MASVDVTVSGPVGAIVPLLLPSSIQLTWCLILLNITSLLKMYSLSQPLPGPYSRVFMFNVCGQILRVTSRNVSPGRPPSLLR